MSDRTSRSIFPPGRGSLALPLALGYRRAMPVVGCARALGALALGAAMIVAPSPVLAAPASPLEQAEAAKAEGDNAGAAETYAAYYRGLALDVRGSETGQYIVAFAAASYRAAYDAGGDRAALEASRGLIEAFLGDVKTETGEASHPWTTELETQLAEIEALLEPPAPEPPPVPATPPEPEPEPEKTEDTVADDVRPGPDAGRTPQRDAGAQRKPDGLGLGLVIGGVVAAGAGVGLLANGTTFESRAEGDALAVENDPNEERVVPADYVEQQARRGQIWMGVGGAVAAIGVAAAIWGAVHLAQHRKKHRASAGLLIAPDRSSAALTLSGRF